MPKPPSIPKLEPAARQLFQVGHPIERISESLGVSMTTIYAWKNKFGWKTADTVGKVEEVLAERICKLADQEGKSKEEVEELEKLISSFGKLRIDLSAARRIDRAPANMPIKIRRDAINIGEAGERLDAGQEDGGGRKKRRRYEKEAKNDISAITQERLDEIRERIFYEYQKCWHRAKNDPETRRTRFILKSRQIGATYYFAWEALEDAILTGENQIFLSASKDQAKVFRAYMIYFCKEFFGFELKGDPIVLSNNAELRFLSTNSRTAQSYHGHLYIDEVFWIPRFKTLWKVASGMSAHKKWRRTLFSTPSAISHEAYPKWNGEEFNAGRKKPKQIEFDISHAALKDGAKGADGVWRHMVTVEDSERGGCNLFDIAELRGEYTPEDFRNLFLCEFIDDAASAFSLDLLLSCGVEAEDWEDYDKTANRPFGNKPVAIGYDPAHSEHGDGASMVMGAVPLSFAEAWRVLRRDMFRGQSFEFQANRIKDTVDNHNVVYIGIDTGGNGVGVYQLVQPFYPSAEPILYNPQVKNELVVKALVTMQQGRLKWDAGDKEIIQAFLMVRKTVTPGTNQVTYMAGRAGKAGHADPAWAAMHMLKYEPIAHAQGQSSARFF